MPTAPISPVQVDPLRPAGADGDRLPAYVSNGVVGLRVEWIPWLSRTAVLNGLAGVDPLTLVESVPTVPFPLGGDLRVGRTWLSDATPLVRPRPQTYDFATGELRSGFVLDVEGARVEVSVVTFASRSDPCVVVQRSEIAVDRPCDVAVRAVIAQTGLPGRMDHRQCGIPADGPDQVDGSFRWHPVGDISAAGYAWATTLEGTDDAERIPGEETDGPAVTTYTWRASPGHRYAFVQLTAMVPDAVHPECDRQAARLVGLATRTGFDELRRRNRAEWQEIWRGRPVLVGADRRWQSLVDSAFFYLHTSVHRSSLASTYIFGLAAWHDYHYYYGHVMWDIESFAVPPLLLAQPDAARAVLDYRWRSLPAARHNARMWGYAGAQFPWQSAPRFGDEATPQDATAAMYEQHVSMGVAHAFAQYAHATGDRRFLEERAWPVLAEVADWVASRAERSDRGYELRQVLGIAERAQPSDNVAFVSMSAAVALRDALEAARTLGHHVDPRWDEVRRGLVLPRGEQGVVLDHDGYTPDEDKGTTPATLCGLFPLGYDLPPREQEATLRFYLDQVDDYLGSPMLSALCGAWAAQLGDRQRSTELFEQGYAAFVSERFLNVHEYRPDRFPEQPVAGPFTANLGAFLTSVLYGLTGLRVNGGDWCHGPVVMPSAWEAVEVERIWVRGRPMALRAEHGADRASLLPVG